MPEVTSQVIKVDHAVAAELLQHNTHNRPVRRSLVDAYSRDMLSGSWLYNGDPIRFATNPDGSEILIDGQHRLLAVIKAATATVPMKVERGYDPQVSSVIDIGAPRSLSDNLRLESVGNAQAVAAVARRLYSWLNYGHPNVRVGKVTQAELRDLINSDEYREPITQAARFTTVHARSRLFTPSLIGVMHVILTGLDYDSGEWFLQRVDDGSQLPSDHPVMALRRRMIKDRDQGSKNNDLVQGALLVVAWNAYRRRVTVSKIQLPKGGASASNFPRPV